MDTRILPLGRQGFSISELASFVCSLDSPGGIGYKYSCWDIRLAAGLQSQCVDL